MHFLCLFFLLNFILETKMKEEEKFILEPTARALIKCGLQTCVEELNFCVGCFNCVQGLVAKDLSHLNCASLAESFKTDMMQQVNIPLRSVHGKPCNFSEQL